MTRQWIWAEFSLRNPVLTASGTFGYGTEFAPFLDLRRLGGFVAKSLTLEPRIGNPPPRIAEAPSGMLNAISLENVGVEAFIGEKLPAIPEGVTVIASVFETDIDRYAEVCKRLTGVPRIAGLEVNVSCPHVKSGGIEFGQDPAVLGRLVRTVRRATTLPLLVKLSPNVTHIAEMARVCEAEGASGISLINAVQALEVDPETRQATARQRARRALRPGDSADRAADGVAGLPSRGDPDLWSRWDRKRRRRGEVPALWRNGGPGGYQQLPAALGFAGDVADGIAEYAARHGYPRIRDLVGALEFPGR